MQAASAPQSRPSPAPQPTPVRRARTLAIVWWLATAVLLTSVAINVERKVTWYLAVDQYGYLTFAHDLVRGKVFHDWPLLGALQPRMPERIDVLVQTYVYDQGRLYCRYSPGFPLILAAWLWAFGEHAVHLLNPTVFLALLCLALAYQARVFADRWRALAGVTLIVLCPTFLHLWALTLVRDLAAHLAGVGGLFLLLPVAGRALGGIRSALAGLAVGFAVTIRPDAVIYVVPAMLVAGWQLLGARQSRVAAALGAGAFGLLVGLAPLLAYNDAATGSPFQLTQGMELMALTIAEPETPPAPEAGGPQVGYSPGAWRGGIQHGVQGGGFRFSHFSSRFPGNVGLLREAYGDALLGLAVLGALLALLQRRALFLTAVPYCVLALVIFSFWSNLQGRYLNGVFVFVPMLIVEGTFGLPDLLARLARRAGPRLARGAGIAAAAALVAAALLPLPLPAGALSVLTVAVPLVAAAATLATALAPGGRLAALPACTLALGLVALVVTRALGAEQRRASFQRPEMERARETLARIVRPGALVITSEFVGRPAENIDYYSGIAQAVYLTDLTRWQLTVGEVAFLVARTGMTPYLLLPAEHADLDALLADLRRVYFVELVADIPPERAIDYFVAAQFHRGVHMQLYRIDVPPVLLTPQRTFLPR